MIQDLPDRNFNLRSQPAGSPAAPPASSPAATSPAAVPDAETAAAGQPGASTFFLPQIFALKCATIS